MGVHLYDSSTYSTEDELTRLRPALAIANANIPCLVWGEDALAFVHCVPTVLFQFHLIVPDDALEAACRAIMESLPYKKLDAPHPTWQEYGMVDPSRPSCYPSSVTLECTGDMEELASLSADTSIAVHPQSFWSVDVRDTSRSVSLEPAPPHDQRIRLPTSQDMRLFWTRFPKRTNHSSKTSFEENMMVIGCSKSDDAETS
ncbi:hypothetical protein IEO21_03419 [Rhodonia placenta]|uniref:Uncharacterized protein n=1 Tax=Rhodonia placenta TaxID=104341 RepID=A0A8H7U490_9APHY|nr:hypothetical protein IEO21_03419 [Postia placenta]